MAFSLIHILSGDQIDFTTKAILELLGDVVNDEINIKGETYRISTMEESTPSGDFNVHDLIFRTLIWIVQDGETTQFVFGQDVNPASILLTRNGLLMNYGVNEDFHILHGILLWHGTPLLTNDKIVVRYLDTDN